jgi:hypothetical protein
VEKWDNDCKSRDTRATSKHLELEQEIHKLIARVAERDARILELEAHHQKLVDEYQSFMSVSRVVTLSNENAKLKDRVALLERCSRNKVAPPSTPPPLAAEELAEQEAQVQVQAPVPVESSPIPKPVLVSPPHHSIAAAEEPVDVPEMGPIPDAVIESPPPMCQEEQAPAEEEKENEEESEDPINVYEKKIKGVMYYIDDDDNIYEYLEDGAMGDIVGRYVTGADNKRKIKWAK